MTYAHTEYVHTDSTAARWTVHVAGRPDQLQQLCTRCGLVLVELTDDVLPWMPGMRVGTDGDGEWFALADARPLDSDEQPCPRMA